MENSTSVHNALDRHIKGPIRDKIAYLWEGESGDDPYFELILNYFTEVNKFANALKSLGVGKGDTVSIYLPMIPELPIAMLSMCKDRRNPFCCFFWILGKGISRIE